MEPIRDLKGIITVLNTPFTEEDRLDLPSLERNVTLALEAGVAGFLVPAMASEVSKLSAPEKADLVACVVRSCDGRAAVIGGTSAVSSDEMYRLAEENLKAGCEGILANIPYENDEQYRKTVFGLDRLQPGFLMLQDWDFGGYGLPVPLIRSLFEEIDSFKCLKIETVPAGVKYSEVRSLTAGKLHLSGGWAVSQMLEGLERGVHAFMPTGMHRIYCRIYSLFQSGRKEEARNLFEDLLPVLAFSNQHLDISVHFFKRLLWRQGVYGTPRVRQPILPFDEIHIREAERHIDRVIRLESEIQSGVT